MKGAHDLIIVGGGPGGSAAAIIAARAGARVLLVERAVFPRDKVCGDCLNPECWDVFDRLGVSDEIRRLPHAALERVSFVSRGGRTVEFDMATSDRGEIALRRRYLDDVLLRQAVLAGAEVRQGLAVTGVTRDAGEWTVRTDSDLNRAHLLIAADGRNSAVARLLGFRARREPMRDRVGLQAHAAVPSALAHTVQMRWLEAGYGGLAPVGEGLLNISLAGRPDRIELLKAWAANEFGKIGDWRTIAPLSRRAFPAARDDGCFLVGDAARVVEPFTGEGIYYAMLSGELAASNAVEVVAGRMTVAQAARRYRRMHARLYRGRLWLNRLAKAAVLHPRLAGVVLSWSGSHPAWLRLLTARIVGPLRA